MYHVSSIIQCEPAVLGGFRGEVEGLGASGLGFGLRVKGLGLGMPCSGLLLPQSNPRNRKPCAEYLNSKLQPWPLNL